MEKSTWNFNCNPEKPGRYLFVTLNKHKNHPWSLSGPILREYTGKGWEYHYYDQYGNSYGIQDEIPYCWCEIPELPECPQPDNIHEIIELQNTKIKLQNELNEITKRLS